jgi:hypothetical protein
LQTAFKRQAVIIIEVLMTDGVPEGMKRARIPVNETWNPDVPQNPEFVSRALGYNFTFEQRIQMFKLQEEQVAREWQLEQVELPPEQREVPLPEFNWLSLEGTLGGQYWSGARQAEIQEALTTGQYKPFTKHVGERISPGDVQFPKVKREPTEFETEWEKRVIEMRKTGQLPPMTQKQKEWAEKDFTEVWRFAANVLYDPVTWVTAGAGRAVSFIGSTGKKIFLTPEGVQALAKSNLISKVTNSLGEVKYYINPESKHIFSRLLRDPTLAKQYVAKEGLKFIGKEIIPKQYLPWNYVLPGVQTAFKGVKSGIDPALTAIQRVYRNAVNKQLPTISPEYVALKINYEGNLVLAKKTIEKNINELMIDAEKALKGLPNGKQILTEYIENPDIRKYFPQLAGLAERFEELHKQRAAIEQSYGILTSTRTNYIRHYLTTQAKYIMGKLGKYKPIIEQAPFSIRRTLDGTIHQINDDAMKKYGVKFFNDDAFFLLQKRMYESEMALQTVEFLNKIKLSFGKSAKDASRFPGMVRSSIPQLKDIYIPKEIETALKNDKDVAFLLKSMGKQSTKEVAFNTITAPIQLAYNTNKAITGIFQRLTTRYFPAFYALNFYGGKFMTYVFGEAGGYEAEKATIDIMRGKKIIITSKTGMKYTTDDINKIAEESGMYKQIPQGVESAQIEEKLTKIGRLEETNIRMAMLINRLKEGDMPGDAVSYVNKYQFDYTKELGNFEQFMSTIVPFWRWQSNIIPLMTEMMITQPGKIATWTKLMQLTWQSPEAQVALPFVPAWANGKYLYYIGGNRSDVINIQTPIESLTMAGSRTSSPLNMSQFLAPQLTIPIEEYRGQETWSGKNITDQPGYLANKFFGRHIQAWAKITNPNIPWWERMSELGAGVNVYQATDWMAYSGLMKQNSERIVNNAIHRLGGAHHGCGF